MPRSWPISSLVPGKVLPVQHSSWFSWNGSLVPVLHSAILPSHCRQLNGIPNWPYKIYHNYFPPPEEFLFSTILCGFVALLQFDQPIDQPKVHLGHSNRMLGSTLHPQWGILAKWLKILIIVVVFCSSISTEGFSLVRSILVCLGLQTPHH